MGHTDGRTPDRCIDPAPHSKRAASTSTSFACIAVQTPKKDNEVVCVCLKNDRDFYRLLYRVIRGSQSHMYVIKRLMKMLGCFSFYLSPIAIILSPTCLLINDLATCKQ